MWKLCHLLVSRKKLSVLSGSFIKSKSKVSGNQTIGPLCGSAVPLGTTFKREPGDEGKRNSECRVGKIGKSWTTCRNQTYDFYLSMRSNKLRTFSRPFQTWTVSKGRLFGEMLPGPLLIWWLDGGLPDAGDQIGFLWTSQSSVLSPASWRGTEWSSLHVKPISIQLSLELKKRLGALQCEFLNISPHFI